MSKGEIDFYPELVEIFHKNIVPFLGDRYSIAFSHNKLLGQMIVDIESQLEAETTFYGDYVPNLKLDILMGVKKKNSPTISLTLFEVKYLNNLALKDFSQLAGYLQVAKKINTGLLLIVKKGNSPSFLSNDFRDMLRMDNLPLNWRLLLDNKENKHYYFKVGICSYVPGNGLEWVQSAHHEDGMFDFESFAALIKKGLSD